MNTTLDTSRPTYLTLVGLVALGIVYGALLGIAVGILIGRHL